MMSVLCSALRRVGCSFPRLLPAVKPRAALHQPSCKSSHTHSLISNCEPKYLSLCPESYQKPRKKKKSPLEGRPQMRGVVLKTLIKKPKKPNSANRKCVRLRLTNGKEVTAYVPGEGHNLQEHNIVLVQGGRLQDTPGVKLVCIRGKYDLAHVKKK